MSADFRLTQLKATKRNNLATFLKAPLDMGRVVHSRVEDARRDNQFELPSAASVEDVKHPVAHGDFRKFLNEKLRSVPLWYCPAFLTKDNVTEQALVPLNRRLSELNFKLNRPVTGVSNDNWSPLDAA